MTLPGLDAPEHHFSPATLAIVIGAGIAGCALTRSLVKTGFRCVVYDKHRAIASETSAVPRALIRPHATRLEQTSTRYFNEAYRKIYAELYNDAPESTHLKQHHCAELDGVLQLVTDVTRWPENPCYSKLTRAEASDLAGTQLAGDALYFGQAGSLNMAGLCEHWFRQCNDAKQQAAEFIGETVVHSLRQTHYGWQLIDADNQVINESPLVIIASAQVASQLTQTTHLPLQKSRGQMSHFTSDPATTGCIPKHIITGKGSVIPTTTGFWAGSTHQQQIDSSRLSTRDDQLNLQKAIELCPQLDQLLVNQTAETTVNNGNTRHSWAGVRYSTPDRLPVVGAAPIEDWYKQQYADLHHGRRQQIFPRARFHKGLYLLTGFGSRGALHSVYAAEILAGVITGDAMQSSDDCVNANHRLLHPGRFIIRQLRRSS